ncbi:MAG: hypothetical protein M1835_001011 [Candelina submexicana]|nr:MAG: hypothetical protein M1835_001011 [Candelina submexicana]
MFASTSTGGSICFRCHLRLTRACLTPKRSGKSAQRTVLSPQARPNTTQTIAAAEPPAERPPHGRPNNAHPLGRLRGSRGNYVRAQSASLDALSLGVPSEVIILRDAKIDRSSTPKPTGEDEVVGSLSAAEILSSFEAEKELISPEETNNNIDKHRPADTKKVLRRSDFNDLAKELHDGFTFSQLSHYLEDLEFDENLRAVRSSLRPKHTEEPAILERSAWTLGVTPFAGHKFDSGRYNDSVDLTRKENLAIRVLRDGWDIKIKEEIESIGELELRLRPQKLSLLVNGHRAFLKDFAERYNAKIDVSKSRGVVRVTADQVTATTISRNINNIVSKVHRMELDLDPLQPLLRKVEGGLRNLRGSTRVKISELTGTELEFSEDGRKLIIAYLGPSTSDAEDARRLFLASITSPMKNQPPITWDAEAREGSGALCPPTAKLDLSWKDRQKTGSRWAFPSTPRSSEGPEGEEPAKTMPTLIAPSSRVFQRVNDDLFKEPQNDFTAVRLRPDQKKRNELQASSTLDFSSLSADPSTTNRSTCNEESRQVCSALLGQILHEAQDDASARPVNAEGVSKLLNRTMSTSISGALLVLKFLPLRRISESLHLRLLPSPWTSLGIGGMEAFPEMEIRVALRGKDKRCFLQRVSAILGSEASDVMLPEKRADLRFRKDVTLDLMNVHEDKAIADFLAESHLDTLGTGQLRAPANLKLHVPRWIVRDNGIKFSNTITTKNGIEEVEMDYLFSGLEYRHSVIIEWERYELEYTTIEAGKLGGRRTELRLINEPLTASPTLLSRLRRDSSIGLDEFMASAYRLVNNLGKRATNNFSVRTVKSVGKMFRRTESRVGDFFIKTMSFDRSEDRSVLAESISPNVRRACQETDHGMENEVTINEQSVNPDLVSENVVDEGYDDEDPTTEDGDTEGSPHDQGLKEVSSNKNASSA